MIQMTEGGYTSEKTSYFCWYEHEHGRGPETQQLNAKLSRVMLGSQLGEQKTKKDYKNHCSKTPDHLPPDLPFLPQRHPRTSFLRNSKFFTESRGICVFFCFFFVFVFLFFLFFCFFCFFCFLFCLFAFSSSSILRFSNLFDKEVFKNEVC